MALNAAKPLFLRRDGVLRLVERWGGAARAFGAFAMSPTGDRFQVTDRELGRGKWGVVLQGTDLCTGAAVAIKHLACKESAQREFALQRRALGPGVVRAIYLGLAPDAWHQCLVSQYMAGGALGQYVARTSGSLPGFVEEATLRRVTAGVFLGLRVCHAAHVAHGDIHDGNILLDADGNGYLSDFGCAREGSARAYDDDWLSLELTLRQSPLVYGDLYSPLCQDFFEQVTRTSATNRAYLFEHPWLKLGSAF